MLQFLEQFSGLFGLLFFVSKIFEYSGSSISPNASSIIVGIIQIIGCYCSTLLVDRAGRKILISTSSFGISIGMFVFAVYSYMNGLGYDLQHFNWIPLASFSFTLWVANLGVLTLPFLVTSELIITLPNVRYFHSIWVPSFNLKVFQIKGYIYTFCLCLSWVFAFIILHYFEALVELIGMSGLMLVFSINCLVGGLFVVVFVPETKGRSFPEILEMLEKWNVWSFQSKLYFEQANFILIIFSTSWFIIWNSEKNSFVQLLTLCEKIPVRMTSNHALIACKM